MMSVILLLAGLLGLWLGTESVIRGAVSIAERLGLSEFIVGVAILSIGSDIPELAIAINGAIGATDVAQVSEVIIGSALGSGLSQISLVLGVAGLFSYLTLPREITFQHGSILLGSIVLLGLFGFDGRITSTEGMALITVYVVYLIFLLSERGGSDVESPESHSETMPRAILFLGLGLAFIFISAELTVSGVMQVADILGVNNSLVAIIVVGIGTSLPELSISIGAVLKGRNRLSVGNLIGSNIFDTLIPIGVAASITELEFRTSFLQREIPILFLISLVVLFFFVREKGIQKKEAVSMLLLYALYVLYKVISSY